MLMKNGNPILIPNPQTPHFIHPVYIIPIIPTLCSISLTTSIINSYSLSITRVPPWKL